MPASVLSAWGAIVIPEYETAVLRLGSLGAGAIVLAALVIAVALASLII
jgi:hypothetical protein